MSTLVLRLSGPLQSWGIDSRFSRRDTMPRPSKSGVIGLLANALGRDRTDDISDLGALRFGVRTERAGKVTRDFHTVLNSFMKDQSKATTVTERFYLSDAAFLAAVEGPDQLIDQLADAVRRPTRPLSLGRRSCTSDAPIFVEVTQMPLDEVLSSWPAVVDRIDDHRPWFRDALAGEESTTFPDQPVSFSPELRRHTLRHVTSGAVAKPAAVLDHFDAVEG